MMISMQNARSYLLVVSCSALSILIVSLGARELWVQSRFAEVTIASRRVEAGAPIGTGAILDLAQLADDMANHAVCHSDLLRSGTTLVLRRLELQDSTRNAAGYVDALERADSFLRHALSCVPSQGNFWLRLAMVGSLQGQNPQQLARFLTLSQLYAPAEEGALKGRLAFWQKVSQPYLKRLQQTLLADLRGLCTPQNVRSADRMDAPNPSLWPYIEQIGAVSPQVKSPWCRVSSQ
jgi:hypothetical protein